MNNETHLRESYRLEAERAARTVPDFAAAFAAYPSERSGSDHRNWVVAGVAATVVAVAVGIPVTIKATVSPSPGTASAISGPVGRSVSSPALTRPRTTSAAPIGAPGASVPGTSVSGLPTRTSGRATPSRSASAVQPSTATGVTPSSNIQAGPVGIGFVPSLTFPEAVSDRAAVTAHLQVTADGSVVEGAWVWAHDVNSPEQAVTARFRPSTYWSAGATVTVTGHLAGSALTATQQGTDFAVSAKVRPDSMVSTIDVRANTVTVTANATIIGRYRTLEKIRPGEAITDGVHTVSATYSTFHGSPDEESTWVVRFSNSGGFIQASDASPDTAQPGRVRLSDIDAKNFFARTRVGDPVQVVNSGRSIEAGDGDWSYTYPEWVQLAADSQT